MLLIIGQVDTGWGVAGGLKYYAETKGVRLFDDRHGMRMDNYIVRDGMDELAPDEKPDRWTAFVALLL